MKHLQSGARCALAAVLLTAASLGAAIPAAAQCGKASWYALTGRTASGERMNPAAMVAAHRSLPFGTMVKVENLRNGRSAVVRIIDRGPFTRGRVIDVSRVAAQKLGFKGAGIAQVRLSVVEGEEARVIRACG